MESAKKRFYNAKQVKRLGHRVLKDEITIGELNDLPADVKDAVMLYVDAYSYMLKFEETGEKYVSERLRKNYIGELVSDTKGNKCIATTRGKPTGTIIAMPDGEGGLKFGVSHVSTTEKYESPIVGLFLAIRDVTSEDEVLKTLSPHEKKQFERFKLRSMAYFYPDKYSYSRGTDPVVYPNYEEIHKRQVLILGEEKIAKSAPQPPAKDAKNRGRKVIL